MPGRITQSQLKILPRANKHALKYPKGKIIVTFHIPNSKPLSIKFTNWIDDWYDKSEQSIIINLPILDCSSYVRVFIIPIYFLNIRRIYPCLTQ